MATPVVYPIAAFRAQAVSFEAALSACLADPSPKAVHQFRTSTRRLEALLGLVCSLEGLPHHKRKATKLRARLRKPRRTAGVLRDIDVQQALLAKHLPADAVYSAAISEASVTLNQLFHKRRQKASVRLSKVLSSRNSKLGSALHRFLDALPADEAAILSAKALLDFARHEFEEDHAVGMSSPSIRQLHSIRKAAKSARYVAEMSPSSIAVTKAARWESLQKSGGLWHDWHTFSATTTAALGEDHPITGAFIHLTERYLDQFRAELARYRTSAQ